MIARQPCRHARFRLTCLAGVLAGLLPVVAAAELMPWEQPIPEEPSLWNDPAFDGTSTSLPPLETETATPADNGPDIPAPRVDAYFDVSFNDSDLGTYGFASSSSGYRFVVGFVFADLGSERLTVAPEVGYFRMNTAERDVVTVDANNASLPQYIVTTTQRFEHDISSLDFGARFGFKVTERVTPYTRAGLGFYHLADRQQISRTYTPKNPVTPDRDPDELQPSSLSDAGISPYGLFGVSVQLGEIPAAYVEHGARRIGGEWLYTSSLGLLLNF